MQGPKYNGLGYRAAKLDVRLVPQQLRQLGDVAAIRACPQHTAKLGKPNHVEDNIFCHPGAFVSCFCGRQRRWRWWSKCYQSHIHSADDEASR